MARKRTAQEIDTEIARLQKEREQVREAEKAGVVARMKEAIAYYGITAADLALEVATRKGTPHGHLAQPFELPRRQVGRAVEHAVGHHVRELPQPH